MSKDVCPGGGRHHFLHPKTRNTGVQWTCEKCGARAILPQPGPQTLALSCEADILFYGGAAGGGKSFFLLTQPLRHIHNPEFGAVIFRRSNPQIMAQGGLWDETHKIYPHLGGKPYYGQQKQWVFKSGAKITFHHMEHENDKHDWDSAQIPLIEFDELTSFSESQFVYMLSRNRSTSGIQPYVRAAMNPDADSWVVRWIEWWIDQETGYPILDRSGVVRWFVRDGDSMVWFADKPAAVAWLVTQGRTEKEAQLEPKSFSFVPADLNDNKILEAINPEYRANLMAQEQVERERLLRGNWKIRPAAGLKFPRDKWRYYDSPPIGLRLTRYWDKASTEGGTGARTAGVLIGELDATRARDSGLPRYWIVHVEAGRWKDAEREAKMKSQAELDNQAYGDVAVGMEEEGGSGGKHSAWSTVTNLAGFNVYTRRATTNKAARWTPLASQQQVGNVAIVKSPTWDWAGFVRELDALAGDEKLDKGKLKDCADAAAGGFQYLAPGGGGNTVAGELIASGDLEALEDERREFTDDEKDQLPDFLRELVEEADSLDEDRQSQRRPTPWDRD